jgi:hypothetical protein
VCVCVYDVKGFTHGRRTESANRGIGRSNDESYAELRVEKCKGFPSLQNATVKASRSTHVEIVPANARKRKQRLI